MQIIWIRSGRFYKTRNTSAYCIWQQICIARHEAKSGTGFAALLLKTPLAALLVAAIHFVFTAPKELP